MSTELKFTRGRYIIDIELKLARDLAGYSAPIRREMFIEAMTTADAHGDTALGDAIFRMSRVHNFRFSREG